MDWRLSEPGPGFDFPTAKDQSRDAELKRLTWIPRKIGRRNEFQDTSNRGSLAAAEADLGALAKRQAPSLSDLGAQFGENCRCGGVRRVESQADLLLGHELEQVVEEALST